MAILNLLIQSGYNQADLHAEGNGHVPHCLIDVKMQARNVLLFSC
jgi:hypothetical protein